MRHLGLAAFAGFARRLGEKEEGMLETDHHFSSQDPACCSTRLKTLP